jgi:hypothetical protein
MAVPKTGPKMTAKRRKKLKKTTFGLPGQRKYPMDTRGRAANAKARATQQVKKGNLTPSQAAQIRAKANKVLGRGKKKTTTRKKGK